MLGKSKYFMFLCICRKWPIIGIQPIIILHQSTPRMETKKFLLSEKDIPTQWYNICADMKNKPALPLHPGTRQPLTVPDLARG